ncbi:hypothetical protein QJS66_19960 [Kocuria rhizophila]|nr:hypothetical protein QJS66_19960 [Kocuria rhizophila]
MTWWGHDTNRTGRRRPRCAGSGSGARMSLRDPAVVAGAALVVWGVLVSALAVGAAPPALNPAASSAYADKLDLAGLLRDPASAVILQVVPAQKLGTWALPPLAGAVVVVRSPIALVRCPPWRGACSLPPNDGYWGAGWHDSVVLTPVVFVALVDAVVRLRGDSARAQQRLVSGRSGRRGRGGGHRAVGRGRGCSVVRPGRRARGRDAAAAPRGWPLPRRGGPTPAWTRRPRRWPNPAGASAGHGPLLMNALVSRADAHWIGNGSTPDPQYVVLDRSSETWGKHTPGGRGGVRGPGLRRPVHRGE